jgi:hypothetical protein
MGLLGRIASAVTNVVKKVVKKAKEVYEDLKDDVSEAIDEVGDTWKEAWHSVKNCTGGLGCIQAFVGGVVNGVLGTIGAVADLALDSLGWSVDVVIGVVGSVVGGAIVLIGAILPGRIGEALVNAGLAVIDGAHTAGRAVSSFFDEFGGVLQRIVTSLFGLILAVLFALRLLYCAVLVPAISHGRTLPGLPAGDLAGHSMRTLEVEVIIIDKDNEVRNPISEAELIQRVNDADRILSERAKIRVKLRGPVSRTVSRSLYDIDAASTAGSLSEWLKGLLQLLGRDNPRHLTVYAVGTISGEPVGLHQPLYGSVFVVRDMPHTTLAHELGHALLSIDRMGHRADSTNLMHPYVNRRELGVSWPRGTPTLTEDQWCSMRQSRWLNWSWECDRCVAVGR